MSFNQIAQDYHLKRKKPWRPLEFFLKYLKNKGLSFKGTYLDLGCANGRNFKIMGISPKKLIGLDLSLELLKIAQSELKETNHYPQNISNSIQLLLGDISKLPFRPSSVNTVFSIATIHHIKKFSERKNIILQIYDTLKKNGNFILTVWRKWQKKFRFYFLSEWIKRRFTSHYKKEQELIGLKEYGYKLVPWTLSKEQKTYYRFYHFFSKKEIKKLLKDYQIKDFKITGGPSDRDNFFIFARRPLV